MSGVRDTTNETILAEAERLLQRMKKGSTAVVIHCLMADLVNYLNRASYSVPEKMNQTILYDQVIESLDLTGTEEE